MAIDVETEALRDRLRLAPLPLIAARVRRARKALGLSHDEFGGRMDPAVSRQHLIKLEKAKHRPSLNMLQRLSEASGRSCDWFLDPEMDPSPFPDEAGSKRNG